MVSLLVYSVVVFIPAAAAAAAAAAAVIVVVIDVVATMGIVLMKCGSSLDYLLSCDFPYVRYQRGGGFSDMTLSKPWIIYSPT